MFGNFAQFSDAILRDSLAKIPEIEKIESRSGRKFLGLCRAGPIPGISVFLCIDFSNLLEDAVAHRSISKRAAEPTPIGDFPELGRKLKLICGSCGKSGKYHVGRVLLDPHAMKKVSHPDDAVFDEAVSYSGIFRCEHCGADGPWKTAKMTRTLLLAALAIPANEPGELGVQFGRLQVFDGKVIKTGAAAEAYLKQKIEEQPENAFIWGRLGNFYEHAGLPDLAEAAFEKSVELDSREVESLYSLGFYRRDEGDLNAAADCFDAAIRHARTSQTVSPEKLEQIVHSALEELFDLYQESRGQIPFPPKLDLPGEAWHTQLEDLRLLSLDLPSDEGFEILTSIYLKGEVPRHLRRDPGKQGTQTEHDGGTIRQGKRPGRNDPCPCGSGRKYKHCCLMRG